MEFDMYTIKDISEITGWSPRQIYDRMRQIDDFMGSFTQRGKKNRILVENGGFKVLRRLFDLENDEYSIKEASKIVCQELVKSDDKGDKANDLDTRKDDLIKAYREQIALLKRQIEQKDKLIDWFQAQIKQVTSDKVKLDENERKTSKVIELPG